EQAVHDDLQQGGLRLVPHVGRAGYKIDFAVLDHDVPTQYLAGIECDGAMYHSAATARDRDRLRQTVLEELGWRLIRIWSLDWYHNKEAQIKKVLEYVAQQKQLLLKSAEAKSEASPEEGQADPATPPENVQSAESDLSSSETSEQSEAPVPTRPTKQKLP